MKVLEHDPLNYVRRLVRTIGEWIEERDKNKQLEKDKTQLTTDLTNRNNEITTILTK